MGDPQPSSPLRGRGKGPGDLDIAPDLLPLRRKLMDMVKRPVNLQASRDIVLSFRGELLEGPTAPHAADGGSMTFTE